MTSGRAVVFSKRAVLRAAVGVQRRTREQRARRGRREAPRGRRGARCRTCGVKLVVNEPTLCSPTAKQISVTERSVVAQQRRGSLETAGQQVRVRRLAERTPELATEVRTREPRGSGEIVDRQRLEVAGVREVLRAEQMSCRRDESRGPHRATTRRWRQTESGTKSTPRSTPPNAWTSPQLLCRRLVSTARSAGTTPTLAVARCARSGLGPCIRDTDRRHGSNSSQPVAPPIRTRLRLGEARPQVLDDRPGPPATQIPRSC